jgi:hypothetical protein
MESNVQNCYTVLAIDKDWDRWFMKFIGVYSTYELAKGATAHHHRHFGDTARCDDHYEYRIFSGELDKHCEIDAEDDLLDKEHQAKYEEEHKKKMEIQRKNDEKRRQRMEQEQQERRRRVTEIFHKIACERDVNDLTTMEMEHVIGFYVRYTVLATTNHRPSARVILDSLKSFEVISNLGINHGQTAGCLSAIMDTYRKKGIKGDL